MFCTVASSVCSALRMASSFNILRAKKNITPNATNNSSAISQTTIRLSLTDKVLLIILGHSSICSVFLRQNYEKVSKNPKKIVYFFCAHC